MKWGNVVHYHWCCHIHYCVLYNEKASEKLKEKLNRTVATLQLNSWPSIFYCKRLNSLQNRLWKNQLMTLNPLSGYSWTALCAMSTIKLLNDLHWKRPGASATPFDPYFAKPLAKPLPRPLPLRGKVGLWHNFSYRSQCHWYNCKLHEQRSCCSFQGPPGSYTLCCCPLSSNPFDTWSSSCSG